MSDETTQEPSTDVPEPVLTDAGTVIMFMYGPDGKPMPVPLPELFNQIFTVLKDFDKRLTDMEERRIIVP